MRYALCDVILAIAAAGALLAVGIQIGRDVERTSAVRAVCEMQQAAGSGQLAECPAVKVITKPAAWNRVYGAKSKVHSAERGEDLRVPERVGWIRP